MERYLIKQILLEQKAEIPQIFREGIISREIEEEIKDEAEKEEKDKQNQGEKDKKEEKSTTSEKADESGNNNLKN